MRTQEFISEFTIQLQEMVGHNSGIDQIEISQVIELLKTVCKGTALVTTKNCDEICRKHLELIISAKLKKSGWGAYIVFNVYQNIKEILPASLVSGAEPTPLHTAVSVGSTAEVKALLGQGNVDINALTPDGYTALHLSVLVGRLDILELLIEAGADPSILSLSDALTAAELAENNGKKELGTLIKKAEAAWQAEKTNGLKCINDAVERDDLPALQALFRKHDVNFYIDGKPQKFYALGRAIELGRVDIVRLMLDNGLRPNFFLYDFPGQRLNTVKSEQGFIEKDSPFAIAVACFQLEIARLLIDRGAKADLTPSGRPDTAMQAIKYLIVKNEERVRKGEPPFSAEIEKGFLELFIHSEYMKAEISPAPQSSLSALHPSNIFLDILKYLDSGISAENTIQFLAPLFLNKILSVENYFSKFILAFEGIKQFFKYGELGELKIRYYKLLYQLVDFFLDPKYKLNLEKLRFSLDDIYPDFQDGSVEPLPSGTPPTHFFDPKNIRLINALGILANANTSAPAAADEHKAIAEQKSIAEELRCRRVKTLCQTDLQSILPDMQYDAKSFEAWVKKTSKISSSERRLLEIDASLALEEPRLLAALKAHLPKLLIKYLIERGISLNDVDPRTGETALVYLTQTLNDIDPVTGCTPFMQLSDIFWNFDFKYISSYQRLAPFLAKIPNLPLITQILLRPDLRIMPLDPERSETEIGAFDDEDETLENPIAKVKNVLACLPRPKYIPGADPVGLRLAYDALRTLITERMKLTADDMRTIEAEFTALEAEILRNTSATTSAASVSMQGGSSSSSTIRVLAKNSLHFLN